MDFVGAAARLSSDDIVAEATALGCTPAIVHAVCDVEAGGRGFLPDGRPKILFEARSFYTLTRGRYGVSNISSPTWDRSLYGASGAHQYDRLAEALRLDRAAALQSASWGMFQIMGSNHRACGFADIESMVAAMMESERRHLDAFVSFVKGERIDVYLKMNPPQFARFAARYNGPGFAQNAYDVKLAAAWRKWREAPDAGPNPAPRTEPSLHYATLQINSTGDEVRALQEKLGVGVDGDFGPATQAAVVAFQQTHGLVPDGIVGPATQQVLNTL